MSTNEFFALRRRVTELEEQVEWLTKIAQKFLVKEATRDAIAQIEYLKSNPGAKMPKDIEIR
jgi:hypothetical protein